ncbi:unnamed protein product [Phyllotreta striolata]|uniref:Uncharacterized protein n=1 Tax=Phyllotreta striolata TaxID=444603 RepID=A0A9N9XUZ3_PHYSR|nr:unnamed protein product [Phyllotreta striolata]
MPPFIKKNVVLKPYSSSSSSESEEDEALEQEPIIFRPPVAEQRPVTLRTQNVQIDLSDKSEASPCGSRENLPQDAPGLSAMKDASTNTDIDVAVGTDNCEGRDDENC